MSTTRTVKILYVLWLLSENVCSKEELLSKLSEYCSEHTNSCLISSYIEILNKNGFVVNSVKNNKSTTYHLKKKPKKLLFSDDEIELLEKIKKIIISQKDIIKIRRIMILFYKIILALDNNEHKNILIDFGYYSNINWYLVQQLEKHCLTQDVILVDYAHKIKQEMKLKLHVSHMSINEWSDKIYLWGELYDNGELSFLPVDRIFMIDKVIEKNIPFKLPVNEIEYKISRKLYKEIELDKEETLVKLTKEYATIKRNKNNKFYIAQRLLSFCPELYYISDKDIKEEVKSRLKALRSYYE